jgi:hypothetical protein
MKNIYIRNSKRNPFLVYLIIIHTYINLSYNYKIKIISSRCFIIKLYSSPRKLCGLPHPRKKFAIATWIHVFLPLDFHFSIQKHEEYSFHCVRHASRCSYGSSIKNIYVVIVFVIYDVNNKPLIDGLLLVH